MNGINNKTNKMDIIDKAHIAYSKLKYKDDYYETDFVKGYIQCHKDLMNESNDLQNVSDRKIIKCKDPMICLRGCSVHEQTCKHPIYER